MKKKLMTLKLAFAIAAGGRYDNLVGAFLASSVSSDPSSKEYRKALANTTPCVGCPLVWLASLPSHGHGI